MNSGLSIGGAPTVLLGADASDGRGDRLTFSVTAAPNAQTGRRNLIVTNSATSESRTKFAAMTIRSAGSNPGGTGGMGGNGGTGGSGIQATQADQRGEPETPRGLPVMAYTLVSLHGRQGRSMRSHVLVHQRVKSAVK